MAYSQLPHDAQIPVGCGLCEGRNKIQWKCIDCSLLMCTKCKDVVHPKFKNATSHIFVDIKELGSDDSERDVSFQDHKCKEHTTQTCGFYCKDCKQFICGKCITKSHRGHEAVDPEEYEIEMAMLLVSRKEAERKFKELTLSNPSAVSSYKSGSTEMAEVKIILIRQFSTEFTRISKVLSTTDDSAWIVNPSAKLMQHVKMTEGSLQVLSEFKTHIGDMAYMSKNEIFLSVGGTSWLQLLNEKMGKISFTYYHFKPLWTRGIHVTRDQKIIIGAVTPGVAFSFNRKRLVVVMDMDRNILRQYEFDRNKKPLFTLPYRITSTSNGNIWVIDQLVTSGRGGVVVLGKTGNGIHVQIYNGHHDVNSQSKPFTPTGMITTPADNVVVADNACNTLHILNCDSTFMTYIRTDGIGIIFPFSLEISAPGQFIIGCASTGSVKAKLYQLTFSGF